MTNLLAIAVGPVQEFIAAARRTRDLWFGSRLLSEISRSVAVTVSGHGELIFPESVKAPNVANVILVELAAGADPVAAAAAAKKAAQDKWIKDYSEPVRREYQGVIRQEIWRDQVDDVIEFYAAWAPIDGKYQDARTRVMRLLAGRKNCRDFLSANGRPGVPKSSLDGLRESVLKDPAKEPWPPEIRARLRIRKGEQLDVVGLVKRVAGGDQSYPSVSRVAADPWIRGRVGKLGDVVKECETLGGKVIRRLNVSEKNGHPHYAAFPFEGTAVFRNRYHELIEEAGIDKEELRPLGEVVGRLGEPKPYMAVLVADGDNMGKTLSDLKDAGEHRKFSADVAAFADAARALVNQHYGVLVYAGGDDVLAFVPVDQCLGCARALHDKFGDLLKKWGPITLSVGVAIGHFMENLEDLREYGQAAEKHAKKPDADGVKNALAVHLHKRGGGPIKVRGKWADRDGLDTRLIQFAGWLRDKKIPNRLASDLKGMAELYKNWDAGPKEAIVPDVLRVIRAKQPGGVAVAGDVEEILKARVTDAASLEQLARELLIARQIAVASGQAAGRDKEESQ